DLISQNRAGTKSFYAVDGLGSTRALTNAGGQVTDRYIYDAFGRTIAQTGSTANVYLFAGEQRDANVGLDYLRARYLSVGTGRFFGQDPFEGILSLPKSKARYVFANNDSVNASDPTGRFVGVFVLDVLVSSAIEALLVVGIARMSFNILSS